LLVLRLDLSQSKAFTKPFLVEQSESLSGAPSGAPLCVSQENILPVVLT